MVVHKFKDESKGKRISEVCAVRLNADCIRMVNEEEIKKANGDRNSVVKNI